MAPLWRATLYRWPVQAHRSPTATGRLVRMLRLRAEKAEAALAEMTRERDDARELARTSLLVRGDQ